MDIEVLKSLIKEASHLMTSSGFEIYAKGKDDFVTEVDLAVQEYICNKLNSLYPEISFMGEESNQQVLDYSKKCWVLDPIDGTTNFIHGFRHSAISLALLDKGHPILGIIYNPYSDEMFSAIKGQGAFINNQPIHVSIHETVENSLIAIGTSPYYKDEETINDNIRIFKALFKDAIDIRRSGSAALDLAYVACGRVNAYLEKNVKLWDYAAGKVLIEEAGGIICDYQGTTIENELETHVVCGNPSIVKNIVNSWC